MLHSGSYESLLSQTVFKVWRYSDRSFLGKIKLRSLVQLLQEIPIIKCYFFFNWNWQLRRKGQFWHIFEHKKWAYYFGLLYTKITNRSFLVQLLLYIQGKIVYWIQKKSHKNTQSCYFQVSLSVSEIIIFIFISGIKPLIYDSSIIHIQYNSFSRMCNSL